MKNTASVPSFSKLNLVLLKLNVSLTQNPIPPMLINTGIFFSLSFQINTVPEGGSVNMRGPEKFVS